MTLKLKLALLLGGALLAGCVTPAKYAPTNSASNEKLQAAQITYHLGRPPTVGVFTFRNSPEKDKAALLQQVNEDTQLLTRQLGNSVPKQLIAAFRKRGVKGGTEETVFIKPLSALGSPTRHDLILKVEISVRTSDRTKPQWTAEISESSVPGDLSGEKLSAILTDRILLELSKAGFIPAE